MAAMSLQSGMISEPPVNVNDSDHSEPARLFVFAHCPGVTRRVASRFSKAKTLGYGPPVNNLLTPASESALIDRRRDKMTQ
ncbi:hypothetical protein NQZ68_003904 [Dissostichus eleginoides]|nr:hypothetical protein NQZ68_003904 [Dissostichus eleginoides]